MTKSPWAASKHAVRTMRNPAQALSGSPREREGAGAEPLHDGRRPRKVRRPWRCSTEEPAGVLGSERVHSSARNVRDPSRPRRQGPRLPPWGLREVAKPITGSTGKGWSAERKSEEVVVAMIGRTTQPVVAKDLQPGARSRNGQGLGPRSLADRFGSAANTSGKVECGWSTAWGRAV